MATQVVILAAGLGKRMHSKLPKVLHQLADKPLLEHVINTAQNYSDKPIVVYGHQGEQLKATLGHYDLTWVEQKEQQGTGHAVLQAMSHLRDQDSVLILYGDVPLIALSTLNRLQEDTPKDAIAILTAEFANPTGYGRILRDANERIVGVVEEKDASAKEKKITEINTGIFFGPVKYFKKWLPHIKNNNAQKEYYLPDIIPFALSEKVAIHSAQPTTPEEVQGVNDCLQLNKLERYYQQQQATRLMLAGVTIKDAARLDIRGDVHIGHDVVIDVNVIFEGRVEIGDNCYIGANSILRHTIIGKRVTIKPNSVIEGAEIGDDSIVGPFARLRPGTHLVRKVHVGNFVEIKNSVIDTGSKVNHLSYIGDSEIGKQTNIGAGTITCNYDGVNKHKTIIGDNVFIGSDTQLIAPIKIGDGAVIGAGSTIAKDVISQGVTITHHLKQRILKKTK